MLQKIAIAIVTLVLVGPPLWADTLGDGAIFRRPITLKPINSDAPGENTAWVEFYTNGAQKSDGSDIRVTAAGGVLVPRTVMQVSDDDDFVRLAFSTKIGGPYFVLWGNYKAEKPLPELHIQRGVVLEVSPLNSQNYKTTATSPASSVPSTAAPSAAPITSTTAATVTPPRTSVTFLLPNVGLAYNPFKDLRQIDYHYSAAFKLDSAVTTQMQITGGTATLEIDGNSTTTKARQPARLSLAAGWHNLEIQSATPSISLSWLRPGDKTFTPFPAAVFAPVAHGVAGNLERIDGFPVADISLDPAAEVQVSAGTYAQRYTFSAVLPESLKPSIEWSFGDGQTTASLRRVNHIFMNPGIYPVTLRLTPTGGIPQETRIRLPIADRMIDRMPTPPVDAPATVRAILKSYALEHLRPEDAFRGMQYFESIKDTDLQIAWGRAWLSGRESTFVPVDDVVLRETLAVARRQIASKNFRDAAESFRLAANKPIGMDTRINLIRYEVMTLCDDVNDAPAALHEAQTWLPRIVPTNPLQMRTAQVTLAYALIATGDRLGAKTAIDAAIPPPIAKPAAVDPSNSWRTKVEDALAKKDPDTAAALLDQWELADPSALRDGTCRLLRVQLLATMGRSLDGARIALQHAQALPESPNAPELLFRAAENAMRGGNVAQAQATMDQLRKQFHDSPFSQRALPQ